MPECASGSAGSGRVGTAESPNRMVGALWAAETTADMDSTRSGGLGATRLDGGLHTSSKVEGLADLVDRSLPFGGVVPDQSTTRPGADGLHVDADVGEVLQCVGDGLRGRPLGPESLLDLLPAVLDVVLRAAGRADDLVAVFEGHQAGVAHLAVHG